MNAVTSQNLTLDISLDQLIKALLELPVADKIRIADKLRAAAAAERWRTLSKKLPNTPEISMKEIVDEVKLVRKTRKRSK
jgi:hypothetical protein